MNPSVPILNRCLICGQWQLEETLSPVMVPDQVGHVQKLACFRCLRTLQESLQLEKKQRQRRQ